MRPDPAHTARAATVRRMLDVAWKAPFVLAATLMVGAGAAQAAGRSGVPPLAAVAALALAGLGVALAVVALWRPHRPHPLLTARAVARRATDRVRRLRTRAHRLLTRPSRTATAATTTTKDLS